MAIVRTSSWPLYQVASDCKGISGIDVMTPRRLPQLKKVAKEVREAKVLLDKEKCPIGLFKERAARQNWPPPSCEMRPANLGKGDWSRRSEEPCGEESESHDESRQSWPQSSGKEASALVRLGSGAQWFSRVECGMPLQQLALLAPNMPPTMSGANQGNGIHLDGPTTLHSGHNQGRGRRPRTLINQMISKAMQPCRRAGVNVKDVGAQK